MGCSIDHHRTRTQIPSRQSESKAMGSSPSDIKDSLTTSNISRKDMSWCMSLASYETKPPGSSAFFAATHSRSGSLLVAPLGHFDFLIIQRFLMESWSMVFTLMLPCGNVGEIIVVAQCLAIFSLVFGSEMPTTGFLPVQGVSAKQLGKFHEIRHTGSLLQCRIHALGLTGNTHLMPELFPQFGNSRNGLLQPLPIPSHPTFFPNHAAEFPVHAANGTFTLDGEKSINLGLRISLGLPKGIVRGRRTVL